MYKTIKTSSVTPLVTPYYYQASWYISQKIYDACTLVVQCFVSNFKISIQVPSMTGIFLTTKVCTRYIHELFLDLLRGFVVCNLNTLLKDF